jgi:hypothetical protein
MLFAVGEKNEYMMYYGVCKEYESKLKRDELCDSKKLKC